MTSQTMLWLGFGAIITVMFVLDLGIFNRKSHAISFREALAWTLVWVSLALAFNVWIYFSMGPTKALEFFTGYLIEKSLSVDNVFVFALLFFFRIQIGAALTTAVFFKLLAFVLDPVFDSVGGAILSAESLRPLFTTMYNMPVIPWLRFNNSIVMGAGVISSIVYGPDQRTAINGQTRNVAFSPVGGHITPRQLGPMIRTPPFCASSRSCCSSFAPSGPSSLKPAEITIAPRTPAAAQSRITPGIV